jgi:HEPN domain-containing protein
MNKDMQSEGERLISEASSILNRDVQNALVDENYNLAVRRSQEVVELVLKGGLKILGVDYPKVHDVAPVFSEQITRKRSTTHETVLRRIEDISLWLSQARAPAFYFERDYGVQDAEQAKRDAAFVLVEVKKILGESNINSQE